MDSNIELYKLAIQTESDEISPLVSKRDLYKSILDELKFVTDDELLVKVSGTKHSPVTVEETQLDISKKLEKVNEEIQKREQTIQLLKDMLNIYMQKKQ